jgi:hypothetical protein
MGLGPTCLTVSRWRALSVVEDIEMEGYVDGIYESRVVEVDGTIARLSV